MKHRRLRWLILILLLEASLFTTLKSSAFLLQWSLPPAPPRVPTALQGELLARFPFETQESLKRWEEKVFKGKTVYQVLAEGDRRFLRSESSNASSGLYVKVDHEAEPGLTLSWSWKALVFPKKKEPAKLSNRSEDDFCARVYAIFPSSNFFKSEVIEYIWDEQIPAGTYSSSPYSDRVKLFVIRSGPPDAKTDGWYAEERDVYADFQKLFGKEPKHALGALALMSDSDNTGSSAAADFGELTLKTKRRNPIKK